MASESIEAIVERVALKPVTRANEPTVVKATVTLSFPLESAVIRYLGQRVGGVVAVTFDDAQGELALEAAEG